MRGTLAVFIFAIALTACSTGAPTSPPAAQVQPPPTATPYAPPPMPTFPPPPGAALGTGPGDLAVRQAQLDLQNAVLATQAAELYFAQVQSTAVAVATDQEHARVMRATADTLAALQAQAQASATAGALAFSMQATSDAQAFSVQATAGASTAQANTSATAAAYAALALERERAAADRRMEAERMDQTAGALLRLTVVILGAVGALAFLTLSWHAARLYLDAADERRRFTGLFMETRAGTISGERLPDGRYIVNVLPRSETPLALPAGDADVFDSQAAQADVLTVRDRGGERTIPRRDPAQESARKEALQLLRWSGDKYGWEQERIVGFRSTPWSAETWSRVAHYLKGHILFSRTGTRLYSPDGSGMTIRALYNLVGERRITLDLTPIETSPPSPVENRVEVAA